SKFLYANQKNKEVDNIVSTSLKVGKTGFEPATPCTPYTCATELRHFPKFLYSIQKFRTCDPPEHFRDALPSCATSRNFFIPSRSSNLRPSEHFRDALPSCATSRNFFIPSRSFEPATLPNTFGMRYRAAPLPEISLF